MFEIVIEIVIYIAIQVGIRCFTIACALPMFQHVSGTGCIEIAVFVLRLILVDFSRILQNEHCAI